MLETVDHFDSFADITDNQPMGLQIGAHYTPGDKGRLLLVEDEPLSQKYCQLLLLSCGYQLDIAANGEIALDHITKRVYQSILMDVGLPDASGIDVTRIIRASDNPNRHVPIIALTAHLDASKQASCLEAGMTAFLMKPVSPNALCELLALYNKR